MPVSFTVSWPFFPDPVNVYTRVYFWVSLFTHTWGPICACVYVCVCLCLVCLYATADSTCFFPCPQHSALPHGKSDEVLTSFVPLWVTKLILHPHPPAVWGRRTTTLSNLGCVCKIGNESQSESHQLRKQLSQWEEKISITGYLADQEKAAHCLVTSFSLQLVAMTLTWG